MKLGDNNYIVFHPEFGGARIEQQGETHPCYQRFISLPDKVAKAYYSRIDGLEVVHRLPVNGMESRVLPAKISAWGSVEGVFGRTSTARDVMQTVLAKVSDTYATDPRNLLKGFRVFLDTREQDNHESRGDFLLVQEGSQSKRVFHVEDSDFGKLRIVRDCIDLLDEYVSYVFEGGKGEFRFSAFSESV